MPPVGLIEEEVFPPCLECQQHKKTHFSDLVKTHSLRRQDDYSTRTTGKVVSKNRSQERLPSIEDTDSTSTNSGSRYGRSNLTPSHSFLHKEFSRIEALSKANASRQQISQPPQTFTIGNGGQSNGNHHVVNEESNYEIVSPIKGLTQVTHSIDRYNTIGTQTSAKSSMSRVYRKMQSNKDQVTRFFIKAKGFNAKDESKSRLCSKSSSALIFGYILMIIACAVIAVVVTHPQSQSDIRPRRPASFAGAELSFQEAVPSESRRRVNTNFAPVPTGRSFDFYDDATVAANPQPASSFPAFKAISRKPAPSQPAPTPVRVAPRQQQESRPVSRTAQTAASKKRQGPSKNFQHQFSLADTVDEEVPIGRKEPEVKIIKSWANTHQDGSYTWGYINTDGSFKNETRGVDCVVRGIYGYVDEATGETLSFPYISGNPCDPNEPDYYYDYDAGTINSGGVIKQERNPVREARPRKLLQ